MNNTPEALEKPHDMGGAVLGCRICKNCGMAEHKTSYHGFKYWLAGVGYDQQPKCR